MEPTLRCFPSGRKLNFLHPTFEQIHIEDIAHHLSMLPRYLGATERPYNNAQHSWFVCSMASVEFKLHSLLHDAAEAYTGDLPGQLKHMPGMEFYCELQDNLQKKIFEKFGLVWTPAIHDYIHAVEKSICMPWEEYLIGRGQLPDWDEFPKMDELWTSGISEKRFLKQFHALYKEPESEFA